MKVKLQRNTPNKRRRTSSTSSSDSSRDSVDEKRVSHEKSKNKSKFKRKVHPTKRIHNKVKSRSSSSNSSSSVDSSTSSSSDSSTSSSTSEERRRQRKKKKSIEVKEVTLTTSKSNVEKEGEDGPSNDIPLELMGVSRSMAPMTKEEWEKKQSVVKRVYDESTGRNRLIKGEGEVIEEIVSKERHKQINQQASKGDGDYFQKKLQTM